MSRTFLANVPVIPVLLHLDQEVDQRGRYWCPYHNDRRPGGKPSAEVRSDPTLLTCWSCGTEATAAELVATIAHVSLDEGLRVALEVAGSIEPAAPRRKAPPSPARLEAEYLRQTTGVRYPNDLEPVAEFCAGRGWGVEMTSYVAGWGWAGDYRGRVVMPWRDYKGNFTALCWRVPPDWAKDGRQGGRRGQLYGAWRVPGIANPRSGPGGRTGDLRPDLHVSAGSPETGLREVWLCEGETDTVWAGFWLEETGVTVLGLPTCEFRPRPSEVELMRGARVVLAFDGDRGGTGARERWGAALDGVASEISTLALPAGKDLCSMSVNPREIRSRLA